MVWFSSFWCTIYGLVYNKQIHSIFTFGTLIEPCVSLLVNRLKKPSSQKKLGYQIITIRIIFFIPILDYYLILFTYLIWLNSSAILSWYHHYLSKTTHIIITNTVLQLDLFCHALPLTEMFKIQTNVFRVMEKYRIFIISQKFCS